MTAVKKIICHYEALEADDLCLSQCYTLYLSWLKVISKYLVALLGLPSGLSGMFQSSWCTFQCHCDFVIFVKSYVYIWRTLKELSLKIILGNGNYQIYCWNLNRHCTSKDYNCGLPDATTVSCQVQWHWLCLFCCWHVALDYLPFMPPTSWPCKLLKWGMSTDQFVDVLHFMFIFNAF